MTPLRLAVEPFELIEPVEKDTYDWPKIYHQRCL